MFIKPRFYIALISVILCFIGGYVSLFIFTLAQLLLLLLSVLCAYEIFLLYGVKKNAVNARRECAGRFSNGDANEIRLHLSNTYPFPVWMEIIDEIPVQFQIRDLLFRFRMDKREDKTLKYSIRPVKRGVYRFGTIHIFVSTRIGLISRRFKTGEPCDVKVYPSFVHLREYELLASSNHLLQHGNKKIRKIGQQLEPDQIKDYVKGDDYRFINWKATARSAKLMTNVFREERAQNLYCLIDKGRTMQSAFEGLSLLDYSINASLALSYVAMLKGDKSGLITFERKPDAIVPATRNATQMQTILETLYSQTTTFLESDYYAMYKTFTKKVKNRSLLIIYTNFDSAQAMQRQLRYLSMLAKRHSVLVVFFENTELKAFAERVPRDKTEIYETIVAEKLEYENALIVNLLRQNNILSLLTRPSQLTVNVINRYIDIKAREL